MNNKQVAQRAAFDIQQNLKALCKKTGRSFINVCSILDAGSGNECCTFSIMEQRGDLAFKDIMNAAGAMLSESIFQALIKNIPEDESDSFKEELVQSIVYMLEHNNTPEEFEFKKDILWRVSNQLGRRQAKGMRVIEGGKPIDSQEDTPPHSPQHPQ